ncbi:MAG: NAD-dependent epimerase/dehydratase family protein, partial [Alphaproteobacteria bacterium]|nr:NAD-dependent epimerase/dehydratase family protein [Alphaproteobacteria bacterium]
MTRILVVGGAGYIGSHACKALAAAGFEPIAFDNLAAGHDWAAKWGPLEQGDLLDAGRIAEVVRRYGPEGAMHFASLIDVGESVRLPGLYWRNNVVGTINLCEALAANGVGALVFSSSCAVYA